MGDVVLGLRVKYDGTDLSNGVALSRQELVQISTAARAAGTAMADGFQAAAVAAQHAAAQQQASRVALQQTEISARQTSAALRMLPAQVTDIVTGLMSGQAPLTVLVQQGGQLKDSFGGAVPAVRAISGYVAGLVNPVSLAAVAATTLAVAYYKGTQEARELERAVILSGNAAGVSLAQLQGVAAGVAQSLGAARFEVANTLQGIVATGRVSGEVIGRVTEATAAFGRVGGDVEGTIKQFADLGGAPVAASLKLNEQYRYLTAAVYEQIRALENEGRASEAAELAQKTYADALVERSGALRENLGYLERGWNGVTGAAKAAWDAMLSVGREDSAADKIAGLRAQIAERERGGVWKGWGSTEALRFEVADLERQQAVEESLVQIRAEAAAQEKAKIDWSREGEKYLSKELRLKQEIARAETLGAAAGLSRLQIQERIAAIEEKYREKPKKAGESDVQRFLAESAQREARILAEASANEKLTDAEKWALDTLIKIRDGKLKASEAEKQLIASRLQAVLVAEKSRSAEAELLEFSRERSKLAAAEYTQINRQVEAKAREVEQIGLTAEGLRDLALRRIGEQIAAKEAEIRRASDTAGREGEVALIREQIAELERLKELTSTGYARQRSADEAKQAADDWKQITGQISGDLSRSLTDSIWRGFEGGKTVARNFFDTLSNLAKTTVLRVFVQPAMTGAVEGIASIFSPGQSAQAGQSGSGGLGLLQGGVSLYNNASLFSQWASGGMSGANVIGTGWANATGTGLDGLLATNGAYGTAAPAAGGAGSWLPTLGGALAAFGLSQKYGFGGGMIGGAGSVALAGGLGGMMSGAGFGAGAMGSLASLGPWGWGAMALASIFGGLGKRGGPKFEGSTLWDFGGDSFKAPSTMPGGEDRDRDGGRAAAEEMLGAITGSIEEMIANLGGDASSLAARLGFNRDPRGDAPSNVGTTLYRDGQQVYQSVHDYGRDDAEFQAGVTLELQRLTLAAIGAAEGIPEIFRQIVAGIDLSTASAEQMTAALAQIEQTRTIASYAEADPFEDFRLAQENAAASLYDAWSRQGEAVRDLVAEFDGSAQATASLAAATAARYQTELQLVAQIAAGMESLKATTAKSRDDILYSTLDDQGKYAFLQSKSGTLEAQIAAATDPAKIQALGEQLNQTYMQSWQLIQSQWSELSPWQQRQNLDAYLGAEGADGKRTGGYLADAEALIAGRFEALGLEIKGEHDPGNAESLGAQITAALGSIPGSLESAADSLAAAAGSLAALASPGDGALQDEAARADGPAIYGVAGGAAVERIEPLMLPMTDFAQEASALPAALQSAFAQFIAGLGSRFDTLSAAMMTAANTPVQVDLRQQLAITAPAGYESSIL